MVRRAPPPLPPHATSTYATQLNQLDLIGKCKFIWWKSLRLLYELVDRMGWTNSHAGKEGWNHVPQLEYNLMNATQHQPVLVQDGDYFPRPHRNPSLEKPCTCTTVSLGIIKDLKQTSSVCFFGLTNFSRQCALSSAGGWSMIFILIKWMLCLVAVANICDWHSCISTYCSVV